MDDLTGFDSADNLDDPGISSNPNHNAASSGGSNLPAPCTLYLTSYGHRFGPFPAPPVLGGLAPRLLQYDIRALPNPPKNVRAKQTGLHKALREWFFSRPEAVLKLKEVCAAIDAALSEMTTNSHMHIMVFCEMGKHRSVAFGVKARCPVIVHHRDVARGKHDSRRRQQHIDRLEA